MNTLSLIKKYKDIKPSILKQYKDADEFIMVNDNDKELEPIKIPLPKPPPLEEIDGFGLPAKEQYFRHEKYPVKLIELEKKSNTVDDIWTELSIRQRTYKDEIDWIKLQLYREFNGCWTFINGKPTYLPGLFYVYLNFWQLDMGVPEYRERDLKFFLFDEFIERKNNFFGFIYPKHRREGATSKASCCHYFTILRLIKCHGGLQSKTENDGVQTIQKHVIEPWKELPFFYKPEQDQGDNPKSRLNFVPIAQKGGVSKRGKKSALLTTRKGLQSSITTRAATPSAYDQTKLYFYHGDEWGKQKDNDINKTWSFVSRCLSQASGRLIHGKAIITTTVEEMENMGGDKFEKLCINSQYHDAEKSNTKRTSTGLAVLFISGEEGLDSYVGRYGESIVEAPTKEQLKYLREKNPDIEYTEGEGSRKYLINLENQFLENNDLDGYFDQKRKQPREYADCFIGASKDIGFNIPLIRDRINELKIDDTNLTVGDYERVDPNNINSHVVWIPNPNGCWKVSRVLPDAQTNLKQQDINGIWRPMFPDRYTASADPFKNRNFKGTSDGGGAVFMERDWESEPENTPIHKMVTYRFVCTYRKRKKTSKLFADDMLKMCQYWGAMMYPETEVPVIWDYFEDNGYGGFLKYGVAADGHVNDKPGFNSRGSKQNLFDAIRNYTSIFTPHERHIDFLEEVIRIKGLDDMTHNDVFTACGGCLLGSRTTFKRMDNLSEQSTTIDLGDYFEDYTY